MAAHFAYCPDHSPAFKGRLENGIERIKDALVEYVILAMSWYGLPQHKHFID